MNTEPRFFIPWAEIEYRRNRLPHWQQPGSTYFVTYRLADSLPASVLDRLAEDRARWVAVNPRPWTAELAAEFHRIVAEQMQDRLDELHGDCPLRRPDAAKLVGDVLTAMDGDRFLHHAWVIMPNHVHALFTLREGVQLMHVVKAWKGVAARRLNEKQGRTGEVWQKDYFDRLIRDREHFWNTARYIRRNPAACGLRVGEFLLHEHPAVCAVLDAPEIPHGSRW